MVHKHREILNNRNAIFSLVKRAAKLSLNRMWRHFSLDDAYTKISGVFCPAPESRRNLLKYLVRVEMASDWFTRIYRSILAEQISFKIC